MLQVFTYCTRLAISLLLITALSSSAQPQPNRVNGSLKNIEVNGLQRTYALEQFHLSEAHGKLPIILYLHGLEGDITHPEPLQFALPFDTVANIEPALIVRPQGMDGKWNAPASEENGRRAFLRSLVGIDHAPVDDIAFLRLLITVLVKNYNGDPKRVYVTGVSAGGYMSARVACELNDTVAAVAIVLATARSITLKNCGGARPIPILLLASTTDPNAPYAGSGHDASAPETAWFFARHNGCKVRVEQPLPHLDEDENSTVSLTKFEQCTNGADVLFYRIDGSGHSVPSKAPLAPEAGTDSGSRNMDIDTAQIIWDFFQRRVLWELSHH